MFHFKILLVNLFICAKFHFKIMLMNLLILIEVVYPKETAHVKFGIG